MKNETENKIQNNNNSILAEQVKEQEILKKQVTNKEKKIITETDSNFIISSKTNLLLDSLINYYKSNINILSCIITQKNSLSLRILDWLVTNYAKKYNIVYTLKKDNKLINFNIYLDYKNQLKAYSKKYFDPFCRRDRLIINIKTLEYFFINNNNKYNATEDEIITTVGQLNFFKWFIENNILNYAIDNISNIDKDMSETLTKNKNKTKRTELSQCASKLICTYETKTLVSFS